VERSRATDPEALTREAYVTFWSLAFVAVVGAFMVTDVSWDIASSRYLAGAFLALAALVPVLLATRERARWLVAGALGVFTALAFGYHLTKGPGTWSTGGELQGPADQLAGYARANGLEYGYGGYDDAPVVTWLTDERVKVFQVRKCGLRLCPYGAHTISSWYRPRPGIRTFLVTHPTARGPSLHGPYRYSGKPIAVRRFGSLTVYVYDHDIGADLGR
jgi:hypothetical protein